MLDDLPWLCDPYIFYLTSRTLSLVQFDQFDQFVVSPLSHFNFNHEGVVLIKLQSLIHLYQFYQFLCLGQYWSFSRQNLLSNAYYFSLCVLESTRHLGCFVIPNRSHTSISFFDYMCSQVDHTLVKKGQMYAP